MLSLLFRRNFSPQRRVILVGGGSPLSTTWRTSPPLPWLYRGGADELARLYPLHLGFSFPPSINVVDDEGDAKSGFATQFLIRIGSSSGVGDSQIGGASFLISLLDSLGYVATNPCQVGCDAHGGGVFLPTRSPFFIEGWDDYRSSKATAAEKQMLGFPWVGLSGPSLWLALLWAGLTTDPASFHSGAVLPPTM